jgi:mRNA interferase MazF
VDLPEPNAAEPGYTRPVVIVQSNAFNQSRIGTIIAVALSSNIKLVEAPGNVRLSAKKAGLSKDSVANVSQIITLDKTFLREKVGELNQRTMQLIDEGMRLVLAL